MKIFWISDKNQSLDIDFEEAENDINDKSIDDIEGQIALDIIENQEEFLIVSPIAWVNLENIDISLESDVLTISWFREEISDIYCDNNLTRVSEVFWWKFSRNIILPDNLDLDSIKAVLEKNILIIKIPKLKFKWQAIKIEEVSE